MQVIKAGVIYFAIVYLVGFVLGSLRTFLLEPSLGIVVATLIEGPLILVASFFAARALVRRFFNDTDIAPRLGMGLVALSSLLAAEVAMAGPVRGWTFAEWLAHFSTAEGIISFCLFLIFAAMPALLPRRLP